MDPICADNCEDVVNSLPEVAFDDCNPEINAGEIRKVYLGIKGKGFTSIASATEWAARLAATDDTKLIALTVIGDKPLPTPNTKDISGGRKITLANDHVLNISIDETNATNHGFVRSNQCSGNYQMWYETSGGLVFGGNDGIPAFLNLDMLIPVASGDSIVYNGSLAWKSKFTEERALSPIA